MTFLTALQILFLYLKLTGIIVWSWFFVMIPLIFMILIFVAFFILAAWAGKPMYNKTNGNKRYF